MNYYSSDPNKSDKFVAKKNSVFSTLTELYNALDETGWCEYSVFSKGQWNNDNKCCGQCNATVLLVQEYFGGKLFSMKTRQAISQCTILIELMV